MALLDTLHLIAAENPLSTGFYAVATPFREHWLLPFDRAAIQQFDWDAVLGMAVGRDIPGFIQATDSGGGKNKRVLEVTIACSGIKWQAQYSDANLNRELGNALDARIWPNFCFPVVPMSPTNPLDRVYYFRIRQQAAWKLNTFVLARLRNDQGRITGCDLLRMETGSVLPGPPALFRKAVFHFLPAEGARRADGAPCRGHAEPIGLYFENRGLLLFRLQTLPQTGRTAGVPWRVGVDFGTSNSCVAFLALGSGIESKPKVEPFEIQTATMHEEPVYEEIMEQDAGLQSEGAAAIFDFPYRFGNEPLLTERFYFPSQFVTRLPDAQSPSKPNFHFEHGFIFPRNAALDNKDARELLDGHPPLPEKEYRVFRLVHDVKWSNRAFRKAFLWHLYKLLVIHAARHGARITEAAFSFPRAFNRDSIRAYKHEVKEIFENHGGIALHRESFVSESVAVQRRVRAEELRADRLVIDVGGGTSDYTALLVGASAFQASYCLAGSYLNDYFRASPSLRGALSKAAYRVIGEPQSNAQRNQRRLLNDLLKALDDLNEEEMEEEKRRRIASYNQSAFFGLLGMLNDVQFMEMAANLMDARSHRGESARKALCGLFLTVGILYSALAYQGARLLRQHRRRSANLRLDFIGNGSRYLLLLNGEGRPGRLLLERLVQSVWPAVSQGERPLDVQTTVTADGKAWVAEGLVLDGNGAATVEVVPDADSLKQFYAINEGRKISAVIPIDELGRFVRLIGENLPGGKLKISPQKEVTVIPFCQNDLIGELTPFVRRAVERARDQTRSNAEEFASRVREVEEVRNVNAIAEHTREEAANSVEPVFITCVRCLLDEVRNHYSAEK